MYSTIGSLLGVCIVAVLVSFSAADVQITNCGSTAEILNLNVDPCPPYKNGGCILQRPSTVTFTLVFRPSTDIPILTHSVGGIMFGMRFPFNGVQGTGCSNIDGGCPLVAGNTYVYTSQFTIISGYPSIPVMIEYKLLSGSESVICFKLASKLQ